MEKFDISSAPLEIERKFLIEYPDISALRAMPGYSAEHIEQSYLKSDGDFVGGRIRRIISDKGTRYVYTYKERISELTRREFEREISEEEYTELLGRIDPLTHTIIKDRHRFGYAGLIYELDVYDFWDTQATLEAEVSDESVEIPIPPCVKLIKEVTSDRRYNNSGLARTLGVIIDNGA